MTVTTEADKQIVERYTEYQEEIKTPNEVLSYYFDPDGKEPISLSEDSDTLIDLEMPNDTIQGDSQSIIIYVKNNLKRNTIVDIDPFCLDHHVSFTEYPKQLVPQELGRLRITFSPSYRRFDALNTKWGFNYSLKIK